MVVAYTSLSACIPLSYFIVVIATSCVLCDDIFTSDGPWTRPLLPSCDSFIYCQGQLLNDFQLAVLFNDSKSFVDLKLKYPESYVVQKYEALRSSAGGTPRKEVLSQFLQKHFEDGGELEKCVPLDFAEEPSLFRKISNPEYKSWGLSLNKIFKDLCRRVKPEVEENSELYSFLYVPNCFVIPGGRFTELYYWDSYWIVKGLLLLGMPQTARGVIENFFFLFRRHGIIPNGSRKYYLQRSEPPLLTHMVWEYFKATKDMKFVRQNIDVLDQEYSYWMKNQMVEVKKNGSSYKLFRYFAPSSGPRPEAYREDLASAKNITDQNEKNRLYINLKSAAESGQDFSTRWIIKNGKNEGELSNTQTMNIVPVDLNAYLHYNAKTIGYFYALLGDSVKAKTFILRSLSLLRSIDAILWRKDRGIWLDYDIENEKSRDYYYLSNFTPLWTGSYQGAKNVISRLVLAYIKETKLDQFEGGMPTSFFPSGLQWDFPNSWSPQQIIVIQGLVGLGTPEAKKEAKFLADKWLRTNYAGFKKYGQMFEKYNVTAVGETGNGGEYIPQAGFGWSNGVVIELLNMYPQSKPNDSHDSKWFL